MTAARAGGWLRRRGAMHQQDGAGLAWPPGRVHGMRRARAMLAVHRVMSGGRDQCVQASMGPFIFCSRGLTRAGASAWLAEGREPPLAGRRHEPAVSAASRAPAHSESLAAAHARTPRALACCQELAAGVCAARPSQGRAGACSPVQHRGEEMPFLYLTKLQENPMWTRAGLCSQSWREVHSGLVQVGRALCV